MNAFDDYNKRIEFVIINSTWLSKPTHNRLQIIIFQQCQYYASLLEKTVLIDYNSLKRLPYYGIVNHMSWPFLISTRENPFLAVHNNLNLYN